MGISLLLLRNMKVFLAFALSVVITSALPNSASIMPNQTISEQKNEIFERGGFKNAHEPKDECFETCYNDIVDAAMSCSFNSYWLGCIESYLSGHPNPVICTDCLCEVMDDILSYALGR